MTQHQLILDYVDKFGYIIPAKVIGTLYKGQMLGSEVSRRCRELRKSGELNSEPAGKFEKYFRKNQITAVLEEGQVISIWERQKELAELRKQYAEETDPSKKKIIEIRGRALKNALQMAEKDQLAKDVVETIY